MNLLSKTDIIILTEDEQILPIPFPYAERSHIEATTTVSGVEVPFTGTISFVDDQTIKLLGTVSGQEVRIIRNTPKAQPPVSYPSGSSIRPEDANTANDYTWFLFQELCDKLNVLGVGDLPEPIMITQYEIQLGGTLANGLDAGPVVMGRSVTIPIGGGTFRAEARTNPSENPQVIELLKNGSAVGSFTVETSGAISADFPNEVSLLLGDTLILSPVSDEGVRNFGLVLVLTTIL